MLDDLMMSQSVDIERQTKKRNNDSALDRASKELSKAIVKTYQNAITTMPYIERVKAIHFVIPCSCRKSEK